MNFLAKYNISQINNNIDILFLSILIYFMLRFTEFCVMWKKQYKDRHCLKIVSVLVFLYCIK
jgi:hypothetical protein